jgi:hypothetical protein
MAGQSPEELIRHQLITLARRKRSWFTEFSPKRPIKWQPKTIIDPRTGDYFTDQGAKDYVADLLESGHPLEEIILKKPPGKKAYVMKTENGIYIKIEMGNGILWGRSFHD